MINFLDVVVILEGNQLITDLYVKQTDIHQYLEASSCHAYHCKKSIPYSQALRLTRICSKTEFFDKRYNQLESWLKQRGYRGKLVRSQILKARGISRKNLLNQERKHQKEEKLTFNITYHPAYSKLKQIMQNIQLLLTSDAEHHKVFQKVAIIRFKKEKVCKIVWLR